MSRLGNKYAGAFVLIHAVLKVLEKCKLIHLAALAIVDFSYRAALAITDGTEGVVVGSITEPDCEEIQGNVRDSQQVPAEGDTNEIWPSGRLWDLLEKYKEIKIDRMANGNLKKRHWLEIEEEVNKPRWRSMPQSYNQIKNKLDNLKKKFKQEKAKQNTTGEGAHEWEFYDIMYDLFGNSSKIRAYLTLLTMGRDHSRTRLDQKLLHHPFVRNSPEASASAQGGGAVRGQRVKRKPPAGQGELAAALRGFTDAYREAKQIKQDEEKARTQLLADMMQLRRHDMFSE
ncbi:hypothetical protein R1sor_016435 [Riccia sorocarpa]|uniref:Myb/SANT-like DNA-binding domain-containing protein n=1 Tax=Riccia sorocarpa TaxID=122646 RepID=A0ABD3HH08_9MARC